MLLLRHWLFPLLAFTVLGCDRGPGGGGSPDKSGGPPGKGGKVHLIAVIPKGTTHNFWNSIHAGAIQAEREINARGALQVKIEWKGPSKEDDRDQQIQVVQNFISGGVSGIVLAPLDRVALVPPVAAATAAGIPVVIFDSGLDGEAGKDFVAYVSTDNYQGGVLAARRLGQVLGGKGNVILLRYQAGSESTMQRESGFLDTIGKDFPGVRMLSKDLHAGPTSETAHKTSENLLTRFRDEVEGIFAPNESSTFGMLRALQGAGLAGKVRFVGFDSSEALMKAMRDGELHGLVLQNPIRMASLAVKAMAARLEGKPVETRTDTGAVVVTLENMDVPEMKLLHSPDLSEWLGK